MRRELVRRTTWARRQLAAAVGAHALQAFGGAGFAEGALEGADARVGGVGGQVTVAAFAAGAELKHGHLLWLGDEIMKFNSYSGPEPLLAMKVRVTDDAGQSWEATMKAGPATSFLLLPGVRVKVRYREGKRDKVTIDDTPMAILEKNPQMKKDG